MLNQAMYEACMILVCWLLCVTGHHVNVGKDEHGASNKSIEWMLIKEEKIIKPHFDLYVQDEGIFFEIEVYQSPLDDTLNILRNNITIDVTRYENDTCYNIHGKCRSTICSCFVENNIFISTYYTALRKPYMTLGLEYRFIHDKDGTIIKIGLFKTFDGADFSHPFIECVTLHTSAVDKNEEKIPGTNMKKLGKFPYETILVVTIICVICFIICKVNRSKLNCKTDDRVCLHEVQIESKDSLNCSTNQHKRNEISYDSNCAKCLLLPGQSLKFKKDSRTLARGMVISKAFDQKILRRIRKQLMLQKSELSSSDVRDFCGKLSDSEEYLKIGAEISIDTNIDTERNQGYMFEDEMNSDHYRITSTSSSITISWSKQHVQDNLVSEETKQYKIKYRQSDGNWKVVNGSNEVGVSKITGLLSDTLYEIRVYCRGVSGEAKRLFTVCFKTKKSLQKIIMKNALADKSRRPFVNHLNPVPIAEQTTIHRNRDCNMISDYKPAIETSKEKNVLPFGATGKFKDSVLNSIEDVKYHDNHRFELISRADEKKEKAEKQEVSKSILTKLCQLNKDDFKDLVASYENRVYLAGPCNIGKSSLASILIGEPIVKTWVSTDGLAIHFGRNGIDLHRRMMVPLKRESGDILTKLLLGNPKLRKQNELSSITHLNQNTEDNIDVFTEVPLFDSNRGNELIHSAEHQTISTNSFKAEEEAPQQTSSDRDINSPLKPGLDIVDSCQNEYVHTADSIQDNLLEKLKQGSYLMDIAPSDLVDFGGQKSFDMTHQLFIQYKGTFILMFDGRKGLMFDGRKGLFTKLEECPQGDITAASTLEHWIHSVLTYCGKGDDNMPRAVFAATHSDKCSEEEKERLAVQYQQELAKMFSSHRRLRHIIYNKVFFINATDADDLNIDQLKDTLVDIAFQQSTWERSMPIMWVPLDLQISDMRADGVKLITKERLLEINKSNNEFALSEKRMEDFLLIQHSIGKVLYFEEPALTDFIVIQPAAMGNILRAFITDPIFWPKKRETLLLRPNDQHFVQLARKILIVDFYNFFIHLGMEKADYENLNFRYFTNPMDFMLMGLFEWRDKTDSDQSTATFGKLLEALTAIERQHYLCQVHREDHSLVEKAHSRLQEIIDMLTEKNLIGDCVVHLGVELGLSICNIQETMHNFPQDINGQINDLLVKCKNWGKYNKVKPTIYRLMTTLKHDKASEGLEFLKKSCNVE